MNRPPIRDGGVLIRGASIIDVGPADALERSNGTAEILDLGEVVLTPGLVNAHAHLELSDATPPEQAGTFVDWLLAVIRSRVSLGEGILQAAATAALAGAAESVRHGVTCVGDISRFPGATRPALVTSPLRVISFGEIQAMAGRRHLLDERLGIATSMAAEGWDGPGRLLVAISPHAPYSVEPEGYRRCLAWSQAHGRPLTTHLAETPQEATFLAGHGGDFRELWDALGDWRDDVPRFGGGPIRLAAELGLLTHPTLLAHVNYIDDDELALLARGQASVVWCPRTHAYFGHPPHRFREMLARGVRVCLGTDSRASSPDLNLLDDLRLVRRQHADLPPQALWDLVTRNAAEALGVADRLGTLAAGRWADLASWPLPDAGDPLLALLDHGVSPRQVWIAGEVVA